MLGRTKYQNNDIESNLSESTPLIPLQETFLSRSLHGLFQKKKRLKIEYYNDLMSIKKILHDHEVKLNRQRPIFVACASASLVLNIALILLGIYFIKNPANNTYKDTIDSNSTCGEKFGDYPCYNEQVEFPGLDSLCKAAAEKYCEQDDLHLDKTVIIFMLAFLCCIPTLVLSVVSFVHYTCRNEITVDALSVEEKTTIRQHLEKYGLIFNSSASFTELRAIIRDATKNLNKNLKIGLTVIDAANTENNYLFKLFRSPPNLNNQRLDDNILKNILRYSGLNEPLIDTVYADEFSKKTPVAW
jgi:hypothetical protein